MYPPFIRLLPFQPLNSLATGSDKSSSARAPAYPTERLTPAERLIALAQLPLHKGMALPVLQQMLF